MMMDVSRARRGVRSAGCVTALMALLAASGGGADVHALDRRAPIIPADKVTITEVFNNILYGEGMTASWGFSCVVRLPDHTILFDTGGEGNILLDNMEAAGIEPSSIDIVFLSHEHGDHIGGLGDFLEQNGEVTVYSPASFGDGYRKILSGFGIEPVEVSESIEICPGAWSTGEMGSMIREQSLVILTDRGPVVVTGCAHPGIVEITARARDLAKRDPLLVMGGFHLGRTGDEEVHRIISVLEGLGVRYVAPSHCTGEWAINTFRDVFGERFIEGGAGKTHDIGKLR
jgi:7,8-dihydropterin-6-yl-methyl-4-(beta-D-ribofuranosyl)aminobenzene 5'-phosphate synthase